jgi:hypothetical protein
MIVKFFIDMTEVLRAEHIRPSVRLSHDIGNYIDYWISMKFAKADFKKSSQASVRSMKTVSVTVTLLP